MSNPSTPTRSLREHPDLAQLKRQAKELLTAFRAGRADAVDEVRAHYHGADAATFAVHDAQLVLARAYGFESWPKLKAFVDGATVSRVIEAVRAGDLTRVKAMIEVRPEIVNMDTGGDEHRALHHAVFARNADMVRLLMAHGADAHIGIYPHRVPTTAMAIATERGYDDIATIIREAEARRPHMTRRYAAAAGPELPREVMDAINRGDAGAAIAFIESTPLLRAHPELLRDGGPDGITLLHIAAARLMPELATWLLGHGADVNRRSGSGFTPIDMLGRWPIGHPHDRLDEVSALLLRHGAEPTAFWAVAMNNGGWLRARHVRGTLTNPVSDVGGLVTFAVRLDRPEMLTLLLDLGFEPDERPDRAIPHGKPLEYCASQRRPELAEILLRRGATLTPSLAVALGKADWLRARDATGTLKHPPHGDGLLTVAVNHGRIDILRLLLELGFDANEPKRIVGGDDVCESRGIPLERAAGKGALAMAQLLLEHGADPNGQTDGGGTPVSTAYRRRDRAMLDLLARYGGVVSAGTAAYHRDVAIARQRIQEEDAGTLPAGAVTPGGTVAEDLLSGDCGEPEIIRMALTRIDWPPEDPRWYGVLRGPLAFWNHVPWIASPDWRLGRDGYLACFRLILARCHANVKGSFGRTILHDVMAMGYHDGAPGYITQEEALAFAVMLLDAGARTDVRDDLLQSTPLGWACRWGRTLIVKEMLARGVDSVERDAPAWATPRAWAEKMNHTDVLKELQKHQP